MDIYKVNALMKKSFYKHWINECDNCVNIEIRSELEVQSALKALHKLGYKWFSGQSLLDKRIMTEVTPCCSSYNDLCYISVDMCNINKGEAVFYDDGCETFDKEAYEEMYSINYKKAMNILMSIHKKLKEE